MLNPYLWLVKHQPQYPYGLTGSYPTSSIGRYQGVELADGDSDGMAKAGIVGYYGYHHGWFLFLTLLTVLSWILSIIMILLYASKIVHQHPFFLGMPWGGCR